MHTHPAHLLHLLSVSAAILIHAVAGAQTGRHEESIFVARPGRAAPLFRQDTLEICILGDIMMHARQIEYAREADGSFDFSTYFRFISDRISSADIAVANMEFTLAGEPYTGYPCFSAPDCLATFLADTGFDIFLAANNHICDKGEKGAMRTIGIYRELEATRGIRFTGISEDEEALEASCPLTVRRKGISLAFVNFTYGTNSPLRSEWPKVNLMTDAEAVEKALEKAEEADFTIVLPHWGTEYRLRHSQEQEKQAKWLAGKGADMIIGSHPHVIQDFQVISTDNGRRNVPVAYSLGNAVSNMSASGTQLELMATVRIARDYNGDMKMLPPEFTYLWCSGPGGYGDSFTVIPVAEFTGRRSEWKGPWDYDKMIKTYMRVMQETGIKEGPADGISY